MYYLLGIDDTDSPKNGDTSSKIGDISPSLPNTAALALTLGKKLESLGLARLINISCHQLFQHPSIPHTTLNLASCLLLDCEPLNTREIDMTTRLTLRGQSAPTANPGYALAAWNRIEREIVSWGILAKNSTAERMDAINLARESNIAIAGISGSGAGVIGALASVGLRYDGNDGTIYWMPGIEKLHGIFTQTEINQFIHLDSIENEHHKHPALDDRIQFTGENKPQLLGGRIVLRVTPAKRGAEYEWQS